MARNTGVLPNQIVGALGACIFYTSLQQALIRGRALSYSKNYSPANMIKKLRWRVAINFTKLVHPWLAWVMPAIIAKQNRNSKITGIFMKMINNIGLFDETKNTTFFFGNGATPGIAITEQGISAHTLPYVYFNTAILPSTFTAANCVLDLIMFDKKLTKLGYLTNRGAFTTGHIVSVLPANFYLNDVVYMFWVIVDKTTIPYKYSIFNSFYPLTSYTI